MSLEGPNSTGDEFDNPYTSQYDLAKSKARRSRAQKQKHKPPYTPKATDDKPSADNPPVDSSQTTKTTNKF